VQTAETRRKHLAVWVEKAKETLSQPMIAKIDTPEARKIDGLKLAIVEPVFGNSRSQKRLDRLTLRGKIKVNRQWMLYCMVHNLLGEEVQVRRSPQAVAGRRRDVEARGRPQRRLLAPGKGHTPGQPHSCGPSRTPRGHLTPAPSNCHGNGGRPPGDGRSPPRRRRPSLCHAGQGMLVGENGQGKGLEALPHDDGVALVGWNEGIEPVFHR
jgi:hypothetical protein